MNPGIVQYAAAQTFLSAPYQVTNLLDLLY